MDPRPLIFKNRRDAGKQLAAALPDLNPSDTVVVSRPCGGVPVAAETCAALELPLDLVLVHKIGATGHPELAVGTVTDGPPPQSYREPAHYTPSWAVAHRSREHGPGIAARDRTAAAHLSFRPQAAESERNSRKNRAVGQSTALP